MASTAAAGRPARREQPAQRLQRVQQAQLQPLADGQHPVVVPAGEQLEVGDRTGIDAEVVGGGRVRQHAGGPRLQPGQVDVDVLAQAQPGLLGDQQRAADLLQPPQRRAQIAGAGRCGGLASCCCCWGMPALDAADRYWATVVFALAIITDRYDGMIARRTGQVTEFGKLATRSPTRR